MVGITHRGQPVQFGGEKEFNLKKLGGTSHLEHTQQPSGYDPRLLGQVQADMLKPGVAKAPDQIGWNDLNDKGKAQYAIQYKAQNGKFPVIRTTPNPDYSEIAWEKNGWIEVVSKPFDQAGISNFLKTYGWGHVHTSFMRGAPPAEQKQQLHWTAVANLWCFMNSLESRGADGNGEKAWRFAIKGLSIPTEEHISRFGKILGGTNMAATAFSKHLIINLRGNGKQYGNPNRIGFETRGGDQAEKSRILDALLNGLQNGHWGATPTEHGAGGFRLMGLGQDLRYDQKRQELQPSSLPTEFGGRIKEHLDRHGVPGMTAADAQRLHNFVASATLYDTPQDARLPKFDQRVGTPLLNFEDLPWLADADKQRAVGARTNFIKKLDTLAQQGLKGRAAAEAIAEAVAGWAKEARLAEPFGKWLDGPNGRQNVIQG